MEYDLGFAIKAINDVNDNIWLGDFEKAMEIADSSLEIIDTQREISDLRKTAIRIRETIREIRKTAREKRIEKRRLWVAEQTLKEIEEKELDPIKNIYGVLAFHLSSLRETVNYFMEAKAQATLENFSEKSYEGEHFLRRNQGYRYTIQRLPDRWEVRAILDTPASLWDLGKLRNRLSNYVVSMEDVSKDRPSRTFEIYSREMYIQVLGQENHVEISIRIPATEDAKRRVTEIVETIISTLTK